MAGPTIEEIQANYERVKHIEFVKDQAAALDIPYSTWRNQLDKLRNEGLLNGGLSITPKPEECYEDPEELLNARFKAFDKKAANSEYAKCIDVRVAGDLPIGILHMGDPHVDDDGTDLRRLRDDVDLISATDGLYGANIGDTTNNWVGYLGRIYADQSSSAKQAWVLAEWLVKSVDWMYLITGNHDAWSGAGDPIRYIARMYGKVEPMLQARLKLTFGNKAVFTINARHQFPGNSMWNAAHSLNRAAQMGFRDDLLIAGHRHISGYNIIKDPAHGKVSHCVQLASYKIHDRYADERGFMDANISPSVITILDPRAEHPAGRVNVFHDVKQGAKFLTFLREHYAKS